MVLKYFSVHFPARQKLGISVIQRSKNEPNVGNTVVESLTDINSKAAKEDVRAGDFVIAVNHYFAAHMSSEDCISEIQKPLRKKEDVTLTFARPDSKTWPDGRNEVDIYEGILQKKSGMFGRWSSRYVKLTTRYIYFFVEDNLKKKFEVQQLSLKTETDKFVLSINGTELEMETPDSPRSTIFWKHSILCVINSAFSTPLSSFYKYLTPEHRAKQEKEERPVFNNKKRANSRRLSLDSSERMHPYWLLGKCKLKFADHIEVADRIKEEAVNDVVDDIKKFEIEAIDLSLERQIVK
eukprot:maker-scaffold_2-snap-gene-20.35-mRNA-1 protein AED:0.00 eAED:0.00 QI:36/1/1/1/1/1/2/110/294